MSAMGVGDGKGAVKNLSPLERFCSEMSESHRVLEKFPWYSSSALENINDFTAQWNKMLQVHNFTGPKTGSAKTC